VFRRSSFVAHWETIGYVAIGVVFLLLVARPFEVVLGARDAGVYATTGFAIARNGGIVQYDQMVRQIVEDQQSSDPQLRAAARQAETNLLGTQNDERFMATRLRFAGFLINSGDLLQGRVIPQFFHLYPAWIALFASLLGLRGGLLATGLLGLLGLWGAGLLGRRLAGRWVGLLGMLFLSLNGVQVWFSRYSTSEACAQFLSFGALYAFAVMQDRPETRDTRPETRDQRPETRGRRPETRGQRPETRDQRPEAGDQRHETRGQRPETRDQRPETRDQRHETRDQRPETTDAKSDSQIIDDAQSIILTSHVSRLTSRSRFAGLLAGLAAGQLALTRIDFFVVVVPLLAYLAYIALAKHWMRAHWALACGLGAMLLHALIHIVTISRAYLVDTLFARLQDQSALVAALTLPLLNPTLREIFYGTSRSVLKQSWRLPLEIALVTLLAVAFVLLRRDGRPQRWFERLLVHYRAALLGLSAASIALLGVYGYLVRPQILTAQRLAAAPGCVVPGMASASQDCLALQGYIGAPIEPAKHPNVLAYSLSAAPKLLQLAQLPAPAGNAAAQRDTDLREAPANGAAIDQITSGEALQLIGKDSGELAYLVKDVRGVTGWVITPTLSVDQAVVDALPIQANNVVSRVINPRSATTFSFANPGESEKIGIAQANLVRVGWYLSPLGVILGLIGFVLWWWRGLNAASWLFLAASLISTLFFVRLSYGSSDLTYIYILRRYMPLTYPAFSLGMAYVIVALGRRRTKDEGRRTEDRSQFLSFVFRLSSFVCAAGLIIFFVVTNRQLYRHVEYAGALDQLEALAHNFAPGDVLLFRGEGRDTPDLVATPLKFVFGLDAFAIRSGDPGKYAVDLAHYVKHWQAQGRQVYLVLGPNGAVELPGLRPVRIGPASLRLPEFQQLRDQKPSLAQEFNFDFVIYHLVSSTAVPETPHAIAADDYSAQVRGFYHTEQIDGATVAWTNGDALLRLPWPGDNAPRDLTVELAPGVARPAQLGPARVCLSFRPEASFALVDTPFTGEQCFEVQGSGMAGYRYAIDPRGQPAPATGTFLLRIASPTWSPAAFDAAQHDPRQLGVQFGGIAVGRKR
jgi:hypothetical protein